MCVAKWDHRHCYQPDNVISLDSLSKSCFLKLALFKGKGSLDNAIIWLL